MSICSIIKYSEYIFQVWRHVNYIMRTKLVMPCFYNLSPLLFFELLLSIVFLLKKQN